MTKPDAAFANSDSHSGAFETTAAAAPAPKRGLLARLRRGKKPVEVAVTPREEGSVLQLKKGYNEIVETMASVRMHMEQQSMRSEQMLQILQQLPDTLKHSADASQAQTRVLETIHHNLVGQNETQNELSKALTGLAGATHQQEQAVTDIRHELTAQREQTRETMGGISDTLGEVTMASQANAQALNAVASRAETSDQKTIEIFEKYRRNAMFSNAFSFAAASLVALFGLFLIFELKNRNSVTGDGTGDSESAADVATDPAINESTGAGLDSDLVTAGLGSGIGNDSFTEGIILGEAAMDQLASEIAQDSAGDPEAAIHETLTADVTPNADSSAEPSESAQETLDVDALLDLGVDGATGEDSLSENVDGSNADVEADIADAVLDNPAKPSEDSDRALPDTFGAPVESAPARAEAADAEAEAPADGSILGS